MFGSITKKKLIVNYEKKIDQKNERIKELNEDKKKLIMNYTNQLKQKNARIEELTKDNKEVIKENRKISNIYLEKAIEVDELKEANILLKKTNEILDEMTDEMMKEINILVDKKIKRLEAIRARSKKIKVKKKCDNRILQLEKRYLQ